MFLFVNFPGPHTPLDACGPYEHMYPPEELSVLPNVVPFDRDNTHYDKAGVQRMLGSYFGKIAMIDDHIGRIIDALKKRGTWDRTLAIFTSDHGESIGSHGRVSKGTFYEESGRVPLVFRWPGHVPAGIRYEALVSLMDTYPTVLEAAGGELSDKHFSRSFLPIATGEEGSVRDAVFSEIAQRDHLNFMIRDDRYKWFTWNSEEMLFEMDEDPYELHNLAGDSAYAKVVGRLKDMHWDYLRMTQIDEARGFPPLVDRIRAAEKGGGR
jgi:choline-sulfatase